MIDKIYALREKAKKNGEPILRDESFKLLIKTVKEKQPMKILEIGTNVGISSVAMLTTCKTATLTGIEIDEEKRMLAQSNYKDFGVADRAKIFLGDASEIIPILSSGYDFIFLDGPKGHYYEYLQNLLLLLNKGGILFADNVLFYGYVWSNSKTPKKHNTIKHSMERFLTAITTDKNLRTTVYDIEDGVSITEKLV